MNNFLKKLSLVFILTLSLIACSNVEPKKSSAEEYTAEEFNHWLDSIFEADLMDDPMWLTRMGRKERLNELPDHSDQKDLAHFDELQNRLDFVNQISPESFNDQTKLSYALYKKDLEFTLENKKFRHHNYPVNQMHGIQSELPSFMINVHQISNIEEAKAYISRINALPAYFETLKNNLDIRKEKGIIPPKFVFGHLLNDCNNLINEGKIRENILYKDFFSKLENIDIDISEKSILLTEIELAIKNNFIPAYEGLKKYLTEVQSIATEDDGVWKFPNGSEYYNYRLALITTTDWNGKKIHELGLSEVNRIHNEMKAIMSGVGFEGSLQDFFQFMRTDKQFYYEDGPAGKEKMIVGYKAIIDSMKNQLDALFLTKPKADIQVKAVEEYREQTAGKAFYEEPAIDGSRPGTFYANLYKMADMPTYEMEALAFHEGIPGHHMQISIAQELKNIPQFRKFKHHTAYVEGWGLYCELLPKEIGFYQDPYSDFGRLAMELWRACRLVVDVGIHEMKWTREEAIKYLMENTPNSENSCTKAIERYIVMPGQATAYKVGMIKILEIREKAKKELGDQFDIKKFHDLFLLSGSVPLDVFEARVNEWVKSVKAQK